MSGLQALGLLLAIVAVVGVFVFLVVATSRSAKRRVERVSRELGIPLPDDAETDVRPALRIDELVERPVRPTLRDRLATTRTALTESLRSLRTRSGVDDAAWEDLEEALLRGDVGIGTTSAILADLRERAAEEHVTDPEALITLLRRELVDELAQRDARRTLQRADAGPTVWLFVGVNGVGKTTTIAKLAQRERDAEREVLLVAADTFRAAAATQLGAWGDRIGAPLVRGEEGADPGSVVHDAMASAASRGTDVVLVDTAGRLHTKTNLMEELKKLRRIVDKTPGALAETLLVIDASTGQNGLAQARRFAEAIDVTGIVLTKLDGTSKGGIVLAIERELDIPVKVVGVGEQSEDLVAFVALEFVEAILG